MVALLFTVYFNIGNIFTSTPQLALLVGNLIGFAFGQRRGINMTYVGKTQIGPTTWELAFNPARPVRFCARGSFRIIGSPRASAKPST